MMKNCIKNLFDFFTAERKNIYKGLLLFFVCFLVVVFDFSCWYSDVYFALFNLIDYLYRFAYAFAFTLILFLFCCLGIKPVKWIIFGYLIFNLFTAMVLFWCQRKFAMLLDADVLLVLGMTNPQECKGFIDVYLDSFTVFTLIGFTLSVWGITRTFCIFNAAFSLKRMVIALLLIAGISGLYCSSKFAQGSAVWHFYSDLLSKADDYAALKDLRDNPILPADIRHRFNGKDLPEKCIGVIVIGESASRNYLSLYGYSRKTTPYFDAVKDSLYVFDNCQSVTNGTSEALRYITTQKKFEKNSKELCTFVDVYKAAGWRVVYLSTPPRYGLWETGETLLFENADAKFYLPEFSKAAVPNDHELLPVFEKELAQCSKPTLFIFHLDGSHVPCKGKYPENFGPFNDLFDHANSKFSKDIQIRINEYTNSLAWTDIFLGRIMDKLSALKQPSFFLYVSDHGESISSDTLRRMDDMDMFRVPLVMWFSPEYKALLKDRLQFLKGNLSAPIEIDRLFCNFLYMGTITYDDFPNEDCLFSKEFQVQPFHFNQTPAKK